jgi:hypothetical protein
MGSDPAGSESEIPKFFRCILEHMYFFGPLVALDGSDSVRSHLLARCLGGPSCPAAAVGPRGRDSPRWRQNLSLATRKSSSTSPLSARPCVSFCVHRSACFLATSSAKSAGLARASLARTTMTASRDGRYQSADLKPGRKPP